MLFVRFFIFIIILYTSPELRADAPAADMFIKFKTGNNWKMSAPLKAEFFSFIDAQLADLIVQVPTIYWPTIDEHSNMGAVFQSVFYPATEKYKNRPLQCAFVQKILNTSPASVRTKFAEITREGQICIQFDLPKEQWSEFTLQLLDFFWQQKWIAIKGTFHSLEDLARSAFGDRYHRPEFFIGTRLELDGYGWGYSDSEIALFRDVPLLKSYDNLAQQYNPNHTAPFKTLGPETEALLKKDPYGMAGSFQPGSKIYISNAWGPIDLIELLAHEYGHVLHGETNRNVTWEQTSKTLTIQSNRVHDESVAESVAWMLLRDIYGAYPEVKFFHLAKLRLFLSTRPRDPHLVGAAAVYEVFHSNSKGSFDDLIEYASTLDLGQYLANHGLATYLENLGPQTSRTIAVTFAEKETP